MKAVDGLAGMRLLRIGVEEVELNSHGTPIGTQSKGTDEHCSTARETFEKGSLCRYLASGTESR